MNKDEKDTMPPEESESVSERIKKFQDGSIAERTEKPKEKRMPFCWKNPALLSFCIALGAGLVCVLFSIFFFLYNTEDNELIFYRIGFTAFAVLFCATAFFFYFPAALGLDQMFRGKNVAASWTLTDDEILEQALNAKKSNRIFNILLTVFSALFLAAYIYGFTQAGFTGTLSNIMLLTSALLFVGALANLIISPKIRFNRMMQNGKNVIIGTKSVYYGGEYYRWHGIEPRATTCRYSSKKQLLTLTYSRVKKNGAVDKKTVCVYAPEREERTILKLEEEYRKSNELYRNEQEKNSILAGTD